MVTRYGRHNLVWIDLIQPTPSEVRAIMDEFAIEPVIAQELLLPSFKSKVERKGDAIYMILHFPTLRSIGGRAEQEIDFLIGKHFLITTHYENIDPLHSFAKAFEVNGVLGAERTHTHGGHLFASMIHSLYQALGSECDAMQEKLQTIEDQVFNGDEKRMVIELSHVGRTIHDFRQALIPHHDILSSLEGPAARMFGAEFSYHIRSLMGSYSRVQNALENLRDSLGELRETNNALLSTKQNEVMKTLTVLAFLVLPLTLVSQLFGMNAEHIPLIGLPGDFWIITGGLVVLAASFLVYFKHKGWL
ncbi:hypothetical protein H7X87_02120 [Acetobacteraceae bacterium]|nr:hypothetical protein [Candidatus Parcubacteria bacterium]